MGLQGSGPSDDDGNDDDDDDDDDGDDNDFWIIFLKLCLDVAWLMMWHEFSIAWL